MTRTFNILNNVRDFAPGAFENTAVENGSIQLGRFGSGYLSAGSYTTPPHFTKPFSRLVPSWNADTPKGTTIEVQIRLSRDGEWSRWFSFGHWSPYIDRASPYASSDDFATQKKEMLSVVDEDTPADGYQLRVFLKTSRGGVTPMVHLLAVSVDLIDPVEEKMAPFNTVLDMPTYSSLGRDPSLDGRMGSACSLAMMLNRWGADLLPEEIARAVYDSGAGQYANLSFLSAVGGMYGFECYGGFGLINLLRKEIRRGHAVAAKVCYRAPYLGEKSDDEDEAADGEEITDDEKKDNEVASEETTDETPADDTEEKTADAPDALPILPEAVVDSFGHLVVVRGFYWKDDEEYVVINDPMQPSDSEARMDITLTKFLEIYQGLFLMLHQKKGSGHAKPVRQLATLILQNDEIRLEDHEKSLIPGDLHQVTTCYTLSDSKSIAYPNAAYKKFFYPRPDQQGKLRFDISSVLGKKMTFYYIGPYGNFYVAEKIIREMDDLDDDPLSRLIKQQS